MMIAEADKLMWFALMWKHIQPHRFSNVSDLNHRMILNKQFAVSVPGLHASSFSLRNPRPFGATHVMTRGICRFGLRLKLATNCPTFY